jgi:hypothetical protein
MTVRLRYHLAVTISSSPSDSKDLGNVCIDVTSDSPNEGGVWKTRVAAGATVVLPLDSISAAVFLMLRVIPADPTQVLTPVGIVLNGGTPLSLAPVGNSPESTFMMTAAALNSLEIQNTDTAAIDIDIVIGTVGD